eukprot:TRINITY_DN2904_c0_g1_i5.p1 TRINITY_DN2904_c0_g1~~TRINITY_DN2904_c0_g1_i5.p1  ORF type:complete len:211 (+),score=54.89 TRINITY_DN2904_c0_g1_i5:245-877(+)
MFRASFTRATTTAQRLFARCCSGAAAGSAGKPNFYQRMLAERPVLTKSLTSAVVVGSGDLICQFGIEKAQNSEEGYNPRRTMNMMLIGGTLVGPTLHYWFSFLFTRIPSTSLAGTVQKMAADQLIFAPLFNPAFVSYLFLLEGRPAEILPKLQADWVNMTVSNWKLWVPAQMINFGFVPPQFQVLFANNTAVIWNTYLSWMAHQQNEIEQ